MFYFFGGKANYEKVGKYGANEEIVLRRPIVWLQHEAVLPTIEGSKSTENPIFRRKQS